MNSGRLIIAEVSLLMVSSMFQSQVINKYIKLSLGHGSSWCSADSAVLLGYLMFGRTLGDRVLKQEINES